MTTDAETGQQAGYAELSRVVGRLEGAVEALIEGHRQLYEELREVNRRLDETNKRIDRVSYTVIGFGTALVVAILVSRLFGG